ncbi:hypothetical protein AG1IA_07358 [Rhizoctonia solani AG-1 IA]|uniref:Uncharacterized protein n=1 Tax=Thanatephorus cucumeris (strain AG1-IA) TaxID=983506 RepID=L8WK99_THACA|nr:hypothetical protein AG1IA_07358 [Rhizoctonia solani AG-1 IA]
MERFGSAGSSWERTWRGEEQEGFQEMNVRGEADCAFHMGARRRVRPKSRFARSHGAGAQPNYAAYDPQTSRKSAPSP